MHLAVAISSHGYGHGAQTATVLTALRTRYPDLRLTLLTGLARTFLESRIPGEFELIDWRGDFGMQMSSALEVDLVRSAADYAMFHANWDARLAETIVLLERMAPDLLLANVPYLPLAASARIGMPSIALCSLNWADIYRHYFSGRLEFSSILACMLSAYNSAEMFLCPAPSMVMPDMRNVRPIGPLARLGRDCRVALCAQLGVSESQRLVVIAPGGIPLNLPIHGWPVADDISWIVPDDWAVTRTDMHAFASVGMNFTDLLASADAVLGKLGYGTVAECACNGTPLLYMPRPDWPEEDCLAEWLQVYGRCAPIGHEQVLRGELREQLEQMWAQPIPPAPQPTGAEEAAQIIAQRLTKGAGVCYVASFRHAPE